MPQVKRYGWLCGERATGTYSTSESSIACGCVERYGQGEEHKEAPEDHAQQPQASQVRDIRQE